MESNMKKVFEQFNIDAEFISCEPYGEGHINDTFLLLTKGAKGKYILQRINTRLFDNTDALMKNIALVTDFVRGKVLARGGNPDRECLSLVKTRGGKNYYRDDSGCYRVYIFITDATAYQVVEKPSDFYEGASAFGSFARLLSEFDASLLYEVLPNFHNTIVRYSNFSAAVVADKMQRAASVKAEIEWAKKHEYLAGTITTLLSCGKIPLRVTHNDTKFNNVMIDNATGKAIAVIDLDTVMPGSLCYDFGDSIRFGCNPAAEDEPDLSKVNFSVELFKAFAEGYLSAVGGGITILERDNLVSGALVMTYECGIRFLTDYLSGDTYFKTHRAGQNLDRARTQFKLVDDMERLKPQLEKIIKSIK